MGGRRKAWPVVFALAGALGSLGTGPRQPVEIVLAEPASLLRAGDLAASGGELALADTQYRRAWNDPATRDEATLALRALHKRPDFRLPIDPAAVAETERVLGPGFRRFDTPHFVVISDCPAGWTRARAALLERTRSEYFRATDKLGLRAAPHAAKLVCVLINEHERYQKFGHDLDGLGAAWVAGYYSTGGNRIVFYNDSTSPAFVAARAQLDEYDRRAESARADADAARPASTDLADRLLASAQDLSAQTRRERERLELRASGYSTAKTIHECVHLLAFNTGVQRRDREYPLWLSEGLATNFETEAAGRAFGPDRPRPASEGSRRPRLLELAAAGRAPALADLLSITAAPDWDADTADAMYALADALFAHLYRREPAALGAYIRDLGHEPPRTLTPRRGLELFVARFGDPADIERRLYRELR